MPLPRQIFVPQGGNSWRVPPAGDGFPLRYLGWGLRDYAKSPVPLGTTLGYVYFVILEGEATAIFTDGRVACSAGHIIIMDRDCAFGWTATQGRLARVLVWTWASPPSLPPLMPEKEGRRQWKVAPERLGPLENLMRECRHELAISDAFTAASLERCQRQLDVTIARLVTALRDRSPRSRLEIALEWIRHNVSSPQPIASLCDYLQVSEPTLHRIFVRHLGRSPLSVFLEARA